MILRSQNARESAWLLVKKGTIRLPKNGFNNDVKGVRHESS